MHELAPATSLRGVSLEVAPVAMAILVERSADELACVDANSAFEDALAGDLQALNSPENSWLTDPVRQALRHPSGTVSAVEHPFNRARAVQVIARRLAIEGVAEQHCSVQIVPLPIEALAQESLLSHAKQLQDLVDNSAALMFIKDLGGRYIIVNDFFARMFHRSASSIVGLTDHDLFATDCADVYLRNDTLVLQTGESMEFEEPYGLIGGTRDPDDDHRWLSIKFPLRDSNGQVYALGAISTDISDRKRAESSARSAQREAELANTTKDEFLSRMSHELRTPLNAILGFGKLLTLEQLDTAASDHARQILSASNHLLALVDDLLDLTWLDAGAPGFAVAEVSPAKSIQEALDIVRPIALERDIEIASDLHGALHQTVRGDERRLRQVFLNLFTNAIKYNREEGAIMIRCEADETRLRVFVTDTGIGLSAREQEKLFAPFGRLRQAPGREGYGLGLAVSRKLIEQMGGTLTLFHSEPGEGSTFVVELEIVSVGVALSHTPEGFATDAVVSVTANPSILHIEDTPANVTLVDAILHRMNIHNIPTAATGRQGIKLAQELLPNLILLDLHLQDMTGLELLSALRDDPRTRAIPVVVLSADATAGSMRAVQEFGGTEYLTKPLDLELFARTVHAKIADS